MHSNLVNQFSSSVVNVQGNSAFAREWDQHSSFTATLDQNKSYFIILVATVMSAKHSATLRTYFRRRRAANVKVTPWIWNGSQLTTWFNIDFISWGKACDGCSYWRDLGLITQQDLHSLYSSPKQKSSIQALKAAIRLQHNKHQHKFQTCYGEHVGALHSSVSLFKGGVNKTHKAAT